MSQQAMTWASELHYDAAPPMAFRVLLKLADVASKDGTRAWRSIKGKDGMAAELGVSERSIQRALRELEELKLIKPGNQSHVAGLRADRRPTVYDLQCGLAQVDSEEQPLDRRGDTRGDMVIHSPERGDTEPGHGATTDVAITSNPPTKTENASHVGERARVKPCPQDARGWHRWGPGGFCTNGCGIELERGAA